MGYQLTDIQQVRDHLQQVNEEIREQNMDEQQMQEFEQMQEQIRGQLAADRGSFVTENEVEFLALRKVALERDLAAVTQLIQEANGTVTVTRSARRQQTPVEVPPEEHPGILKKITNFFQNLFKKEKKLNPWLSARQRKRKLRRDLEKNKQYDKELIELETSIGELTAYPMKKGRPAKLVRQNYEEYRALFVANGWCHEGAEVARELQNFFREIGNSGCFANIRNRGNEEFDLNEALFTKEDIKFVLSHPNDEGVLKFVKPVLEINMDELSKKYPIHKARTPEKRAGMIQDWYLKYGCEWISSLQWAEKFGREKMSPDMRRQFEYCATQASIFTKYINLPISLADAPSAAAEMLKKEMPLLKVKVEHAEDLRWIATKVQQGPHREIETDDVRALYEELRSGRMVTKEGRIRLLPGEPLDRMLMYGEEDLQYYKNMKELATWLKNQKQYGETRLTLKEFEKIECLGQEFSNLYEAVLDSFRDLNRPLNEEFNRLQKGFWGEDRLWYQKKLYDHMDEYEQKKKAEKKAKK